MNYFLDFRLVPPNTQRTSQLTLSTVQCVDVLSAPVPQVMQDKECPCSYLGERTRKRDNWGVANSYSSRLLRRPQLECLEDRCLPSAYYVTSATDDGSGAVGTLSAAINSVNAGMNGVIDFNIGAGATAT